MTDEPDKQEQINAAAEGEARNFLGKRLHPFSFSRQACWQRLDYERVESVFESACAIVFLCTLGDEIVEGAMTGLDIIDSARGPEGLKAFRRRFEAWAENLSANNEEGREANRIGQELWAETATSRFKPVIPDGKAAPPNA